VEADDNDDFGPDEWDGPSKSQKKRESEALQALGVQLVGLSRERLTRIEMPDKLRTALIDAQRITANGAKRRQMQYIGKLMRGVDVAPLQAALDEINGVSAVAIAYQKRLERLRARIMEDDAVFAELMSDHPRADIQHLRQLRRNALKEAEQSKPPRAYRELFRQLRSLVETRAESEG
jgi:ribosome-associated protein